MIYDGRPFKEWAFCISIIKEPGVKRVCAPGHLRKSSGKETNGGKNGR